MKFTDTEYPIFAIFAKEMLDVIPLRFYPEDLTTKTFDKRDNIESSIRHCPSFNNFREKHYNLIREAIKEAKQDVLYITQSKINEIVSDYDKEEIDTDNISFSAIWHNNQRMPTSMIYHETIDVTIMMIMVQQSMVSMYVLNKGDFDTWQSKHLNEEEHQALFAMGLFLHNEYNKYLKAEAMTFGRTLKPGISLRLPNEISPFENKTKTTITILN